MFRQLTQTVPGSEGPVMTDAELIDLAVRMRECQRRYARDRDRRTGLDCQDYERRFDAEVNRRKAERTPGLFSGEGLA
jgi:hypothetical protein